MPLQRVHRDRSDAHRLVPEWALQSRVLPSAWPSRSSMPTTCRSKRQVRIMQREGLRLIRTLSSIRSERLARVLWPAYDRLGAELLDEPVLFVDETPLPMLGKDVKSAKWYAWMMASEKAAYYEIHETRGLAAGKSLLAGFKGHAVTDGYARPAMRSRNVVARGWSRWCSAGHTSEETSSTVNSHFQKRRSKYSRSSASSTPSTTALRPVATATSSDGSYGRPSRASCSRAFRRGASKCRARPAARSPRPSSTCPTVGRRPCASSTTPRCHSTTTRPSARFAASCSDARTTTARNRAVTPRSPRFSTRLIGVTAKLGRRRPHVAYLTRGPRRRGCPNFRVTRSARHQVESRPLEVNRKLIESTLPRVRSLEPLLLGVSEARENLVAASSLGKCPLDLMILRRL